MRATTVVSLLAVVLSVSARPTRLPTRMRARQENNGQLAVDLNAEFATAQAGDACDGEVSCVGDQLGQCVNGAVVATACAPGTICRALPLVNAEGTSVACTTQADFDQRIADAGVGNNNNNGNDNNQDDAAADDAAADDAGADVDQGANNAGGDAAADNGDPATSLTLDPSVIAPGFALTGQETPTAGQAESLTSTNNFINFCIGETITDGKQVQGGSCNPCPIGKIPSVQNMPSSKFVFPPNGDATIQANTAFTVDMAIANMETGVFVNAQTNYFAAPQQLNGQGQIIGHTHIVIELLDSLEQTTVTNPQDFEFFKGVNDPAANGIASAVVDDGLEAGAYRVCSINASSNHQPVIVPVAQHGALDDCSYFTVV